MNMNSGNIRYCDVGDELELGPGVSDAVLVGSTDTAAVTGDVTTDDNDSTVTDDSTVYGDVVAEPTSIGVDGESGVAGAVVVEDGSLSLDSETVAGHVYVDGDDISSCSDDSRPRGRVL